jgi:hypothetical protein
VDGTAIQSRSEAARGVPGQHSAMTLWNNSSETELPRSRNRSVAFVSC